MRKLNIKKHFSKQTTYEPQTENTGFQHSGLRNSSVFNPQKGTHHHVEVFKSMVQGKIQDLEIKRTTHSNKLVMEGIKALEQNKNIVVRPADKGGGVVILKRADYYGEIDRLLSATDTYLPLSGDPLGKLKLELSLWVEDGKVQSILTEKGAHYLVPKVPRTPVLYIVPKIHKNKTHPPGRPIISGIGSLYSRVGEYLDFFLQPLVVQGKAYLKDSKELIKSLASITVSEETWLVTVDVESLYTNIRQADAILAVKEALEEKSSLPQAQIGYLVKGLKIAMGNNYFWAQGDFYKQIKGVAMGARYAPSVANLVLNRWEEETIFKDNVTSLIYYRRYIDDILLFWEGPQASLEQFLSKMNTNNYGLSFTAESSKTSSHFLDLTLTKKGSRVLTKTYFKPTDRNGFVPISSCHHPKWLGAIPKGQYMRIRRNCDDVADFELQAAILTEKFIEKGYTKNALWKTQQEVLAMDRESLLETRVRPPRKEDVPFISGYHRQYRSVEKIVKEFWPILLKDMDLVKILPKHPTFIYKKAPGLRNMVATNVPDPPEKPHTFLDGSSFHYCTRCRSCKKTKRQGKKISKFTSSVTGQEFTIKPLITCHSKFVTYVLECPCTLQYVGRTTRELKVRINEHVANIIKGYPEHSVSKHFDLYHNRDPSLLKFYGIDRITKHWRGTDLTKAVSQNETQWIHRLRTMRPLGLNIELDLNCFLTDA